MTLMEVLIYIALLSFLLTGFLQVAFDVNLADLHLIDEIYDAYR